MSLISKEFLEKILDEPILDFKLSAGAQPGDNVAGSLQRVTVTTALGKVLNLVYKGLPENAGLRDYAERFGIFRTETTMYQTVRSRIEGILKTRGVKRADVPMPKFLAGSYDSDHEYLLLEDVRPEGYVMPNKFKGLNLSEVTLVFKEIARFHASTYFWIKQEGEQIFDETEGLKALRDSMFSTDSEEMKAFAVIMVSNEVKNAIKILKSQNQNDWAQKLQNILDSHPEAVYKIFRQNINLTDVAAFPCIIHGDLWLNNIMIKYDLSGNAVDLKFLDFQMSRRGNIFEELQYLLICSTTPAFRKEHFPQVLETYYEAFVSTLNQLKSPIPIGFTRGSFIDSFYEGLLPAYIYSTFAIPLQLAEPADLTEMVSENGIEVPTVETEIPDGPASAMTMEEIMIKNFEQRGIIAYNQMLKSPKAIERLLDITREMVEMNIL